MRKIRDILRLRYEAGLAYRGIANALNIGYGTVVDYLKRAERAGLSWSIPEGLMERDLGQLLITGVDIRVITVRFTHRAFQVVRYDEFRYAAKVFKGFDVRM